MANKDAFQRYLDAGIAFTNMTRARAEELVHDLVQSGECQSGEARAKVDELIDRTRKGREAFVLQVRREVANQLDSMGITDVEDLAKQVASLLARTAEAGRSATAKAATKKSAARKKPPAKKAPAKKAPAKKPPAKKSPAKKSPAKKAAAKKSPVKKAAAKKSPVKKAAAKKSPAPSAGTGSAG